MKRKCIVAVGIAIMMLAMVACGKDKNVTINNVSQATVDAENNSYASDTEASKGSNIIPGKAENVSTEATIQETVLYDKENVKITATDLSYNTYEVELNILIENNSDKTIEVISGSMGYCCNSINGYMVMSGYMIEEVAAGKKAKDSIGFDLKELKMLGISKIADICVGFDIQDPNNKSTYTEPVKIETSMASVHDYSVNTYGNAVKNGALSVVYGYQVDYYAEKQLYNHNDVAIVSQVLASNTDGDKMLYVELLNNSAQKVYGIISDIYINGLAVQSGNWKGEFINSGARCVMEIKLDSVIAKDYWSILGIGDVGEVMFNFTLKDSNRKNIVDKKSVSVINPDVKATTDIVGTEVYNSNGIRILSKGIVDKSSDYIKDINLLFLVVNNTSGTIEPDVVYESLSLNGYMVDEWTIGRSVIQGKCGVIEVEPTSSSLEKNSINKGSDIKEAELTFEIKDTKYNTIAETKVKVQY